MSKERHLKILKEGGFNKKKSFCHKVVDPNKLTKKRFSLTVRVTSC